MSIARVESLCRSRSEVTSGDSLGEWWGIQVSSLPLYLCAFLVWAIELVGQQIDRRSRSETLGRTWPFPRGYLGSCPCIQSLVSSLYLCLSPVIAKQRDHLRHLNRGLRYVVRQV